MSLDPNLRNKNVLIFTRISSLLTRILFNEGQRACPLKLNNFLNHKWSDNQYFSLENEGIHLSEGQGACVPQEPVKFYFFKSALSCFVLRAKRGQGSEFHESGTFGG